jgi:hypothetical protein
VLLSRQSRMANCESLVYGAHQVAHRGRRGHYIVALPEDRRRTHWDLTVQLLLDTADPCEISRQPQEDAETVTAFLHGDAGAQRPAAGDLGRRVMSEAPECPP